MNNILINEREVSELMLKYNFALQLLETQFNMLIKEFEFKNKYNPVEHIKARIKTEKSAIDKLERKGYEVSIKNLILHGTRPCYLWSSSLLTHSPCCFQHWPNRHFSLTVHIDKNSVGILKCRQLNNFLINQLAFFL